MNVPVRSTKVIQLSCISKQKSEKKCVEDSTPKCNYVCKGMKKV